MYYYFLPFSHRDEVSEQEAHRGDRKGKSQRLRHAGWTDGSVVVGQSMPETEALRSWSVELDFMLSSGMPHCHQSERFRCHHTCSYPPCINKCTQGCVADQTAAARGWLVAGLLPVWVAQIRVSRAATAATPGRPLRGWREETFRPPCALKGTPCRSIHPRGKHAGARFAPACLSCLPASLAVPSFLPAAVPQTSPTQRAVSLVREPPMVQFKRWVRTNNSVWGE